jgi:hypothetical protein
MGMFSARGRLSRPAGYKSTIRLHSEFRLAAARRWVRSVPAKLGMVGRAATNDARIVAVLLVLAAVALGLEMAASFRLI